MVFFMLKTINKINYANSYQGQPLDYSPRNLDKHSKKQQASNIVVSTCCPKLAQRCIGATQF